jgi:hypothetical protein
MKMTGNSSPSSLSDIYSNVIASRVKGFSDDPFALPEKAHHLAESFNGVVCQCRAMGLRNDHQMSARIRICVHDDIAMQPAGEYKAIP